MAGLTALAWLREFNIPIYKACIYSAMNFAKISLFSGNEPEFRFLSPKELSTQSRSFFLSYCSEIYSLLVKDLKTAGKPTMEDTALGSGYHHSVSNKRRFGVAQRLGLRRYAAQITANTAAVLVIAKKYFVEDSSTFPSLPNITEQLARKWVRELKTPSRIATQILSHYSGRKPRTIKALLHKARKISKLPSYF